MVHRSLTSGGCADDSRLTADKRARGTSSSRIDLVTSASSSSVMVESSTRADADVRRSRNRASGRGPPILFRRPAERFQQAGRIEDVAPRRLRPLAFDQADDGQVVEVAIARGLIVEKIDAAGRAGKWKRLLSDRAADGRREVVDRPDGIVMRSVRVCHAGQHVERRGARELLAGSKRIRWIERLQVSIDEGEQPAELLRRIGRLEQRASSVPSA